MESLKSGIKQQSPTMNSSQQLDEDLKRGIFQSTVIILPFFLTDKSVAILASYRLTLKGIARK